MATVIGAARPDCDWKEKNSRHGCREQAAFLLYLKTEERHRGLVLVNPAKPLPKPLEKHQFHACRSHVKSLFDGLVEIARMFQKQEPRDRVRVMVADLELLKDADFCKATNIVIE